jgi:hypothetical protein
MASRTGCHHLSGNNTLCSGANGIPSEVLHGAEASCVTYRMAR